MKENMEERAERLALYIIENQTTVRGAAGKFGISKSTVHMDDTKQNGSCRIELRKADRREGERWSCPFILRSALRATLSC